MNYEKELAKASAKAEQIMAGFINIKPVSASAKKVLQKLESMMVDGYVKIDNTNGVYTPVSVEKIGTDKISVAHYHEQNGDLITNPEVVFLKKEYSYGTEYYPVYEKSDVVGFSRDLVLFNVYGGVSGSSPLQAQTAGFCTKWLANIKAQQKI